MRMDEIKYVHMIGIGGIGMSALARFFRSRDVQVSGYDRTSSRLTASLERSGISIYHEDRPEYPFGRPDLVIYTPAVSKDHPEFELAEQSGLMIKKRSEVLGLVSQGYKTLGVAGTHGKTTTTAMIISLMKNMDMGFTGMVGGILPEIDGNYFERPGEWMVTEADEFDRSFLTLNPELAVINSLDADHLDVYGSSEELIKNYAKYVEGIEEDGCLLIREGLMEVLRPYLAETLKDVKIKIYGLSEEADYRLKRIEPADGRVMMQWTYGDNDHRSDLILPGLHNALNALAAMAACIEIGLEPEKVSARLADFKGIRRRFEKRFDNGDVVIIDDYAHHPTEISATIRAARWLYPDRRLIGVFQSHTYSRTRDFLDDFAESLEALDVFYSCELYPAREEPILGIDGWALWKKVDLRDKRFLEKGKLAKGIDVKKDDVILIMGAGNIDSIIPELIERIEEG